MTDHPFEPSEPTPELAEAAKKREKAAKAQIKDADVARLKEVLTHLPLLDSEAHLVSQAAWKICFALELARQEIAEKPKLLPAQTRRDTRKPLATAVTEEAANWFFILTGKAVTRVSKRVDRLDGLQEAGEFASFLIKVFGVFGIQAGTGRTSEDVEKQVSFSRDEGVDPPHRFAKLSEFPRGITKAVAPAGLNHGAQAECSGRP